MQQATRSSSDVVQPPIESTTVADVLIGAIGLTGAVLVLCCGATRRGASEAALIWRQDHYLLGDWHRRGRSDAEHHSRLLDS